MVKDRKESLADFGTRQLSLQMEMPWMSEALQIMEDHELKRNPKFTGEKVYKGDPERYGRIVAMRFGVGMTVRDIAKVEKCSPQTVTAIVRRELGSRTAQEYRDQMSHELGMAVSTAVGRIMEDLTDDRKMKKTPLRDKVYLVEKVLEKKELLSGGATHRAETVTTEDEARERAIRHAKAAEEIQGEIVDFEMREDGHGTQEAQ